MGESKVVEANELFYQAFNECDLEGMRRIWAADSSVVCVHPGWQEIKGHEAVMKSWSDIFASSENLNIRLSHLEVELSEELAWVACQENLSVIQPLGVTTSAVYATNLFRLIDGEWKMILHHASSRPASSE